jgi:hypothetical protein
VQDLDTPGHQRARSRLWTRPLVIGALLALLALLAGCAGPAAVVDFYVNPATGDDANEGTVAEPYRTLTHALSVAAAGHTIHLAAGTYDAASGEVWPTHVGLPPTAPPNVPDGVTITGDGNLVRLVGPVGFDSQTALVFAAGAEVSGINILGFEVAVLAGQGSTVVLDGVDVSGSGEIGVIARGDAQVTVRNGAIYQNSAVGLAAIEEAVVLLEDSEVHQNLPGVEVSGTASLTITGSDLHDNGAGIPGGLNSAVSVLDEAQVIMRDTVLRDNAYAGIHLQGAFDVTIGPGTVIHGNYLGVVADAFLGGAASLAFEGATVRDNAFEGVYWAIPMGASFTMRDTAVVDNGDNGLFFHGDAVVIDLGTPSDPGGNDYSGNAEPLILDARPARVAADGTVVTLNLEDAVPGCPVVPGTTVGPADLDCNGTTVVTIVNLNNRVQNVAGP